MIKLDPSFEIRKFRKNFNTEVKRPVVSFSKRYTVKGGACPQPDHSHSPTAVEGAAYRLGRDIPGSNVSRPKFRKFVQEFLEKNLKPLHPQTDTSFETWIEKTPYTQRRKAELTQLWQDKRGMVSRRDYRLKCFVKRETYDTYKHARGIYSRSDMFKCEVGPIFSLIGDELFKLPYFIKKVPVCERPEYIVNLFRGHQESADATDFTSFEAHFTKQRMDDCEMQFYEYMVSQLPNRNRFLNVIRSALMGKNQMYFKDFIMEIESKRMSGEMCTSSGNGFSNLMFILYVFRKSGTVIPVIEGDDGLIHCSGKKPDPSKFAKLGLDVKLERHSNYCEASFCGLIFDKEDKLNVTEPLSKIVKLGWLDNKYSGCKNGKINTFYRCKALSMAYSYPRCPMLGPFARRVLCDTQGCDVKSLISSGKHSYDQYQVELILKADQYLKEHPDIFGDPPIRTRLLFERKYGISVEMQKAFEDRLSNPDLSEIYLDQKLPKSWNHYWNTYVSESYGAVQNATGHVYPFVVDDGFLDANFTKK